MQKERIGNPENTASTTIEITRVQTPQEISRFYKLFCSIFDEKKNDYSEEYLLNEIKKDGSTESLLFFIKLGEKEVGIRWVCINPDSTDVAYVVYGGILPAYRGQTLYPQAMEITDNLLKNRGVQIVTMECLNPENSPPGNQRTESERRIRFFRRNGFAFVDPSDVQYLRPGEHSTDKQGAREIDDTLVLGYKFLYDPTNHINLEHKNATVDNKTIGHVYLGVMQLDTGVFNPKQLHKKYHAVREYFETLSEHPRVKVLKPTNLL